MNAMRLMLPMDKPAKDCQGCCLPDETKASAHILSFQLADKLLRHYSGSWELVGKNCGFLCKDWNSPLGLS